MARLLCFAVAAATSTGIILLLTLGAYTFSGPILWIALAAYIVFAIPQLGHYSPYGLLLLAVLGLVVLGLIPVR